jgi:CRP-like cAMP-binding protein
MEDPMLIPTAAKLSAFVGLSASDLNELARLSRSDVQTTAAKMDLISEGENPRSVKLILRGWACRQKLLPDGRRQVLAYLLPGDICDLHVFILRAMDHSITAVTDVTYARLGETVFEELADAHPRIMQALLWDALVSSAIQREWTTNIGRRTATERVAHLLCELFLRMRLAGLARGNVCEMPLTQIDVADATGLTAVHVNRTLQALRAEGLIEWRRRELHIRDLDGLKSAATFDSNYLHLDHDEDRLSVREF